MRIEQQNIIEEEINDPKKLSPDKNESDIKNIINVLQNRNAVIDERETALDKYFEIENIDHLPILSQIISDPTEDIYLRQSFVRKLSWIKNPEEIPEITNYLLNLLNELNEEKLIFETLTSLLYLGNKDCLQHVINAIIELQDSWQRSSLADDFREKYKIKWKDRADKVIQAVKLSNIKPETIDESAIIRAIRIPDFPQGQSQEPVIDYLIENALDQDSRMTGIFAKLIVEICSGSQSIAGQKIIDYEKTSNIATDQFKNLRIAIGGAIALDPLLSILTINLEKNFQEPITDLNKDTRNMWQKTIRYAQYGFTTRMWMSVIVFLVGIILLVLSSWEILYGQLKTGQLFGVGVSFVTGLGMMLTIVYRGPLKEIKRSVNDLGVASAAFIAYVHRVLEISHTFSFYYLNQKITFDEMDKSSGLIDEAMKNTVELLSKKESDSKK